MVYWGSRFSKRFFASWVRVSSRTAMSHGGAVSTCCALCSAPSTHCATVCTLPSRSASGMPSQLYTNTRKRGPPGPSSSAAGRPSS